MWIGIRYCLEHYMSFQTICFWMFSYLVPMNALLLVYFSMCSRPFVLQSRSIVVHCHSSLNRVRSPYHTTFEQGWKQKDTNEMILSFFYILHFYNLFSSYLLIWMTFSTFHSIVENELLHFCSARIQLGISHNRYY